MLPRFLSFLLLVGIAYIPAYSCGFIWDDDQYVTDNGTLRTPAGLEMIWFEPGATPQYYPMVFSTFWVEYHLWKNAAGYHAINVLLHGLNSGLVWLLLRRLQVPWAWLAAAIFALHPVHVESVAWITERKNVLSGFFYLCSFLAFLRFSRVRTEDGGRRAEEECPPLSALFPPSFFWYALSLVLFVAALLSKSVTCSLPAVLVLVIWWKRGMPNRRDILALLPMFIIGAALAYNTAYLEKAFVGAEGKSWDLSPIDRCLIAGRALWFYAGKLAWPQPLIFIYPRWHIDAGDPVQYIFPLAVIAVLGGLALLLVVSRNGKQLGRGPLTACLIFAGTLMPALGFVNVYPMQFSFVADHFQYLASFALIALAVAAVHNLAGPWMSGSSPEAKALAGALAGGALLTLGVLTWNQCRMYRDVDTVWWVTRERNPNAWLAQFNYGTDCMNRGLTHPDRQRRLDEFGTAIDCFEATLKILPDHAGALNNWGNVLDALGQLGPAEEKIAQAQKIESALPLKERNPDIALNMGVLKFKKNELDEAAASLQQAISIFEARIIDFRQKRMQVGQPPEFDPKYSTAYARLGEVLGKLKRDKEAKVAIEKSFELYQAEIDEMIRSKERLARIGRDLEHDFMFAEIHFRLGKSLVEDGQSQRALPYLQRAAEIAPKVQRYQDLKKKVEGEGSKEGRR